jgi:hypothetical protein
MEYEACRAGVSPVKHRGAAVDAILSLYTAASSSLRPWALREAQQAMHARFNLRI